MISNWLAFAVLVYGLGVGAKWWPGPIAAVRRLKASRSPEDGSDGDDLDDAEGSGQGPDAVTPGDVTRDGRATRTRRVGDIGGDKPQDTDGDTRHDIPSPGLWARLCQAAHLVVHPDEWDDDAETDDGVTSDPAPSSPRVTPGTAGMGVAPPPKVVVQYVPQGAWTGNVAALDADGNQVILQYRTRSELGVPVPDLSGPDVLDDDDDDDGAEVASIDEVALRQDWLRAIEADGRFSNAEIIQMYREKWGRGRRTLARDRAALAETPIAPIPHQPLTARRRRPQP